jgi:ribosome-associated translation inhibitor RaiA
MFIHKGIIMTFFKSTLLTTALVLLMLSSHLAYANKFQNNACEVNLNGDLVLSGNRVTITDLNDDVIVLTKDGEASQNGKNIALSKAEQAHVREYVSGIEQAVPKALALASKAIDLTNYALTEVFTGLLGTESKLPKMLNEKLDALKRKLDAHIYQKPEAITFDGSFFGMNSEQKSEFETAIDTAVDEVLSTAMAEMFIALGRGMLSGNGNLQDLETRMEQLSNTVEQTIEKESQKLADDALELCESLDTLDRHETQLQSVEQLKHLDFFKVTLKSQQKA